MPQITIDGKQIEFKPGQTIIQAARHAGIEIPHFCWHPELSVSGNCRVCLVEVEKMPKLVISCATFASEGMVVHTKSEKALEARNAVMEFILINHPLDCPICDEAGECKLQEYAYAHGKGESRFEEIKNRKEKRVQLGPYVKFDAERCISCSRCIRFSDEIAKANQLTFVKRGDRVTITTFPGESFDNPYSLNVVDICPVGALTNQDFRFKSRVWEMSHTESICIGCSRGCNIDTWVRNNQILRLTPRFNPEVNSYWMCDNGRLNTFKHVNSDTRIDGVYIRHNGALTKSDWDTAYKNVSTELRKYRSDEILFIGSPYATLEDNYVLKKLAAQFNSIPYFLTHIKPGDQDDILIREDKTPNSTGAELLGLKKLKDYEELLTLFKNGKVKAAYIVEDNPAALDEELKEQLSNLKLLVVHATNRNETSELAHYLFPAATYAEKHGSFVNFMGRLQRIKPAVETVELDRALDGMSMSRWDKFGTKFDRWKQGYKYDALPSWKILSRLINALNEKVRYNMAEEVFNEISNNVEAFKGIDYDSIGEMGVQIKYELV